MSQLKAKQLKLAAEGDLLIGGSGGTGTTIAATGKAGQILRVVDGRPAWSVNDNLKSANTFNTVTAADATGVKVAVQNAGGTAAVDIATFKSGSAADESFEFSSTAGELKIAAKGTATDVDIVIAPQGGGDVIIGNEGGGIIQADDGEDLALFGGEGAGNLFLNGGGTGKIYYASDASDATKEIATKGDVSAATAAATVTQTRSEFDGSQTFTLQEKAIPASIIVHVNGLVIKAEKYAYNGTTRVVTFTGLDYTLDNIDQVVFTYEVTA
jgi:hypothetical protein